MKTQRFHTKLTCRNKPILRQIEWGVQEYKLNLLQRTRFCQQLLFFKNFVSVLEPLIKSWFNVPTTQMSIFIIFESVRALFEGIFFIMSIIKCRQNLVSLLKKVCFALKKIIFKKIRNPVVNETDNRAIYFSALNVTFKYINLKEVNPWWMEHLLKRGLMKTTCYKSQQMSNSNGDVQHCLLEVIMWLTES